MGLLAPLTKQVQTPFVKEKRKERLLRLNFDLLEEIKSFDAAAACNEADLTSAINGKNEAIHFQQQIIAVFAFAPTADVVQEAVTRKIFPLAPRF